MTPLPIIAGFGGISPAGRSSLNRGYQRLIENTLSQTQRQDLVASLAGLSGAEATHTSPEALLRGTLIRALENNLFDPQRQRVHTSLQLMPEHHRAGSHSAEDGGELRFRIAKRQLPTSFTTSILTTPSLSKTRLPEGWRLIEEDDEHATIACTSTEVMLATYSEMRVTSAGQLPSGFDPAALYASRNHPRALQMTVYGASDAINSLGIPWAKLRARVAPDAISVYAGNCMGQLDSAGFGGMLQARLLGNKVSSKQLPLGLIEMPADFINAYLLGNLGTTGTSVAACATFLYNLRQGIKDIQSGESRIAIVGTSEAPLTPEVFEGFNVMGALAEDSKLRALDSLAPGASFDSRRACRPFGNNCGFTLAESSQFVILMDDALALELGANILGSVSDVFINADGYKKSIAGPGAGNYLTVAKAAAAARSIVGERALRERSIVQAHGTGTPQNRGSESAILNRVAKEFGIQGWRIAAVKAFVGHSLASSAGDQLMSTLGLWAHGTIPGIETVTELADDVKRDNLDFVLKHRESDVGTIDVALLNSKGFGGNNASATVLAPHITQKILAARHGQKAMTDYFHHNEAIAANSNDYDAAASRGDHRILYHFDDGVLGEEALAFGATTTGRCASVQVGENRPPINLDLKSPYAGLAD